MWIISLSSGFQQQGFNQSLTSLEMSPLLLWGNGSVLRKKRQLSSSSLCRNTLSCPLLFLLCLLFAFLPLYSVLYAASEITLQMYLHPYLQIHIAGRWHGKPYISIIGWGTEFLVSIQNWGTQSPAVWGRGKSYREEIKSYCRPW